MSGRGDTRIVLLLMLLLRIGCSACGAPSPAGSRSQGAQLPAVSPGDFFTASASTSAQSTPPSSDSLDVPAAFKILRWWFRTDAADHHNASLGTTDYRRQSQTEWRTIDPWWCCAESADRERASDSDARRAAAQLLSTSSCQTRAPLWLLRDKTVRITPGYRERGVDATVPKVGLAV